MKNWQKYYLAGLWDGDGSFGIGKTSHKNQYSEKRWVVYQPFALITLCESKSSQIFEMLETEFGFKCVWSSRRDNPNWNIAYRWCLFGQKAADFAKLIEPYLIIKKERARILMQWPEAKKRYQHPRMTKAAREIKTAMQEDLYHRIKALNKRGS